MSSPPSFSSKNLEMATTYVHISDPDTSPTSTSASSHHRPYSSERRASDPITTTRPPAIAIPADDSDPPPPMACIECGRTFSSWKALFGHMRCHPNRPYRGMIPPVHLRRHRQDPPPTSCGSEAVVEAAAEGPGSSTVTEEHEVADSLLMMASGSSPPPHSASTLISVNQPLSTGVDQIRGEDDGNDIGVGFDREKVFDSHLAGLRGHTASPKNVGGCFANTMLLWVVKEESQNCCSTNNSASEAMTSSVAAAAIPRVLGFHSNSGPNTDSGLDLELSLGPP